MVAPKAPDLALTTALLVRALQADRRELCRVEVVPAHRDEAIGLEALATLEDLLDGRPEVVIADLLEDPAEPGERLGMALEERLLGLDR